MISVVFVRMFLPVRLENCAGLLLLLTDAAFDTLLLPPCLTTFAVLFLVNCKISQSTEKQQPISHYFL